MRSGEPRGHLPSPHLLLRRACQKEQPCPKAGWGPEAPRDAVKLGRSAEIGAARACGPACGDFTRAGNQVTGLGTPGGRETHLTNTEVSEKM